MSNETKKEKTIEGQVLKEIALTEGEIDVRELTNKDYRQIEFRILSSIIEHLHILTKTLTDLNISLSLLAKHGFNVDLNKIKNDLAKKVQQDLGIKPREYVEKESKKVD